MAKLDEPFDFDGAVPGEHIIRWLRGRWPTEAFARRIRQVRPRRVRRLLTGSVWEMWRNGYAFEQRSIEGLEEHLAMAVERTKSPPAGVRITDERVWTLDPPF